MTFPSAPPSIKMRAGCPLIEPINVSNVRSAAAAVKDWSLIAFLRCFLARLLEKGGGVRDVSEASRSRSAASDNLKDSDETGTGCN